MKKLLLREQGAHWENTAKVFAVSSSGVFFLVFSWSLIIGLLIQLAVLPALPGLHAGHGLMKGGDWIMFHRNAVELTALMQVQGWQVWELRPQGNAPIGIASAAYFLAGISEPWVLVPINAAVFALAAVSLHGIFTSLVSGRLAFMATLPFVMFPSAALIYSQIHKDVFSIAGTLLIALVWVRFAKRVELGWRSVLGRVALTAVGCLLVWVVRPYLLQSLMIASLLSVLLLGIMTGRERRAVWWAGIFLCLLVQAGYSKVTAERSAPTALIAHSYLEGAVATLNAARAAFAMNSPLAGSNIDTEVRFGSVADIASYIPRALQVGVLSPFPSMWVSDDISPGSSVMRFISGMEMTVSYVLLIGAGLLLFCLKDDRPALLVAILMAMVLILVLALVVCNVGTLYRMRYCSWQLLNGLGVLGWGLMLQARRAAIRS